MDVNLVASIIGVLGLILSIFVFVLARYERRPKLSIQLYQTDTARFYKELQTGADDINELVGIRTINIGGKPIVIDKNSYLILRGENSITVYNTEWIGIDHIPYPLIPGESCEVAIYQDAFEDLLGAEQFKKYMNTDDYNNCSVLVEVSLRDHEGRTYRGSQYYSFYISEFIHSKDKFRVV